MNPSVVRCMDIVKAVLKDSNMSPNDIHGVVLVGGSTKIPKVHELLKEYFKSAELWHSVNLDQAVVHGAAFQAAIQAGGKLQGKGVRSKLSAQDITVLSMLK